MSIAPAPTSPDSDPLPSPPRRSRARYFLVGLLMVFVGALAFGYSQRHAYGDDLAELSRGLLGDETTLQIENFYFRVQDRADQLKYRVFGGETNPFGDPEEGAFLPDSATPRPEDSTYASWDVDAPVVAQEPPAPTRPAPMPLPKVTALRENLQPGEGVWSVEGLPRTSAEDVLMARTLVHPDASRPYAAVGVLLLDKRRIRLQVVGGTADSRVRGPGRIAAADVPHLLAAWNGGFRLDHGSWGMVANGLQYKALRDGYASLVVYTDGTFKVGQWGRDVRWSDDIVAVRQNAVLLVDNCEVSRRTTEGNDTWGYVWENSTESITSRSAVGLTANGDLIVAAGTSVNAATFARALGAAGACWAMQLDINVSYVLISLFFPQADGSVKAERFMDRRWMPLEPDKFFKTQERDFMYVVLDETNYD